MHLKSPHWTWALVGAGIAAVSGVIFSAGANFRGPASIGEVLPPTVCNRERPLGG